MPMIEVSNLWKTYRLGRVEVPVLRGVDFACAEGECVAVLGASGSGKSTLLHLIGGLDRPDSGGGTVRVDGKDLTRSSAREMDDYRSGCVGFVFQFYHLLPELTVLENVLLAPMVHRGLGFFGSRTSLRGQAAGTLDALGLGHRLSHRPAELSGGERQRVAIARALINQPRVFLADEPTGNLDRETGQKILDAIMDFRRRLRQTMVIVTHDEATAARADRVVKIRDGVIVGT
ncbi:MAG: ABC transporter ATP-binding protein [Phycisphaerales bacterium]